MGGTQLVGLDRADEGGTLPELPVHSLHTSHTVPPWTGELKKHFPLSLSVLFALLVNPVCCARAFPRPGTVPKSLSFSFNLLEEAGLKDMKCAKFTALEGISFPLFLPFLPPENETKQKNCI